MSSDPFDTATSPSSPPRCEELSFQLPRVTQNVGPSNFRRPATTRTLNLDRGPSAVQVADAR